MTAVVFAVTAANSVLGLVVPAVLDALERTPDGLHGQWWRLVTALFVQDGGVLGTVSNLAFLALLGLLVVALLAGTRLPPLAPMAVLWWCGAVARPYVVTPPSSVNACSTSCSTSVVTVR